MQKTQTVSEKSEALRKKFFPFVVGEYLVDSCDRESCMRETKKNFLKVFPEYSGFQLKPDGKEEKQLAPCRAEYNKIHSEYFLIYHKDKVVGWFMGEMDDFETFYMRNTGILPKHQNGGIYSAFIDRFISYITSLGYQKISSHHSPHNKKIFKLKMDKGFIIVGTENYDRWGSLVKMIKYLDKKREALHKKKFD